MYYFITIENINILKLHNFKNKIHTNNIYFNIHKKNLFVNIIFTSFIIMF